MLPFDPNKELEGLPDRKKKKRGKTSVGCPINVSICRLSCYSPFIPKGKVRARLKDQGRIQTVQLSRCLTGTSVKKIINRAFQRIGSKWIYLETGQHNQLVISKEQCPHGNSVCSQRGCLYIVDQQLSLSLSLKCPLFLNPIIIQMATMKSFEVEDIVSVRKTKEGSTFEIKWKGYDDLDWVKQEYLNCPEFIKAFMASLSKVN